MSTRMMVCRVTYCCAECVGMGPSSRTRRGGGLPDDGKAHPKTNPTFSQCQLPSFCPFPTLFGWSCHIGVSCTINDDHIHGFRTIFNDHIVEFGNFGTFFFLITSMGSYYFYRSHRWVCTVFEDHIDGCCTVFWGSHRWVLLYYLLFLRITSMGSCVESLRDWLPHHNKHFPFFFRRTFLSSQIFFVFSSWRRQ